MYYNINVKVRAVGRWQGACMCTDPATCGNQAAHELHVMVTLAAWSFARPAPYAALGVWAFGYLGTVVTVC